MKKVLFFKLALIITVLAVAVSVLNTPGVLVAYAGSDDYELPFLPSTETEHKWDNGTVTTPATCTEPGVITYTCIYNSNHTYTEVIPPHHTERPMYTVEPTCTEGGYDFVRCTVCKATYETNFTEPLGHNYDLTDSVAPTCVKDGYDLYICVRCEEEKETVIPATGHQFAQGYCTACGIGEKIAPYDLNGDTKLDALDLSVLVNGLLVGNKELTLDVSGDGNVNIIDLIKMKNQIANM